VLLGNGAHPQVFAAAAARLARARSVYVVHMIHRVPLWANGPIDALAVASPFALAVSNSTATLEAMRRLRPRARHALVHPGVPDTVVDPGDAREARRELGAGDGEVLFGVFGRLQRWKGQDVFVEAAARVAREVPGTRFAVVGGSVFGLEPQFARALALRAGALGLGGRIVFAGQREDVPRLMAACDVVCHTTRVPEPFGMVIAEAMAQARPVVATRGGGPSEIVEEGGTGLLVPPDDAAALANAMRMLGIDSALRDRMGARGRERARERFTSDRAAAGLAAALGGVAG
jgi:glycosyltransferase involved in cell wall biosynthesis